MAGPLSATATAEAVVDLDAIARNTALLAGRTTARLMAVVKADGFGHGLVPVARTALAHGASWLGVTSCAEALQLRAAGVTAPILSWLHGHDEDFRAVVAAGVELSVASPEHLQAIAATGTCRTGPVAVHLKVDTGLSRNGAAIHDWPELVRWAGKLAADGQVEVRGVWSHLATADTPDRASVARQVRTFEEAIGYARAAGLDPALCHLANSAAILDLPGTHYDLVRAGVALYGIEPVPGRASGLRPAMTLRARAVLTKRVPPGTGVSYGYEYVTPRAGTLLLVPLGFADGVPRGAGGRAEVWFADGRHPIAGRIAMDQFVVDVGDLPARPGDEVVVFGPGDRGEPTVTDWARWAGTNPHEILTGIGGRVPRRYLPAGRSWTDRSESCA
ncbi:alanine racemase [Micromonospora sp. KC606]|uniref:alanine racemase n=1 Tax=Micromonospora sp. KC606 TaxID=2530379 RepID=UPI00104EB3E2|nr:alanine racemase [Micromonospora sp. KC606]TDC82880.1 alanine racemase [Micromonospora sp. KC606]